MAKAAPKPEKKSAKNADKTDKFALYVAVFVVLVLVAGLGVYFFTHTKTKIENKQNYVALPQLAYTDSGQTVRMQVMVQVAEKDQEWLKKNRLALNEIFKITIEDIDPVTFRTNEGRVAVQEKLKEEFNSKMHTDKVEAVLYNDLLIQNEVEK